MDRRDWQTSCGYVCGTSTGTDQSGAAAVPTVLSLGLQHCSILWKSLSDRVLTRQDGLHQRLEPRPDKAGGVIYQAGIAISYFLAQFCCMVCWYSPWVCAPKSPVPTEYRCSFKKVLNQNMRSKADVISLANSDGPWGLCKTVVKSLQLLGWVSTMLVALEGWQWAVRLAGCTCVYFIHSHLTCRELWIQLENNTHLQLIAWDISFNSSWRELDAWIGVELHFLVIMLLIMANLLFVNNVLSRWGDKTLIFWEVAQTFY